MKHIIFFITHSTLNEINCELTFKSISIQQMDNKFDIMYIQQQIFYTKFLIM